MSQLGGFQLHLIRDLSGKASTVPLPSPVPVVDTTTAASDLNGSINSQLSLPFKRDIRNMLDNPADEGLVIIRSPRVRTPNINVFIVL